MAKRCSRQALPTQIAPTTSPRNRVITLGRASARTRGAQRGITLWATAAHSGLLDRELPEEFIWRDIELRHKIVLASPKG